MSGVRGAADRPKQIQHTNPTKWNINCETGHFSLRLYLNRFELYEAAFKSKAQQQQANRAILINQTMCLREFFFMEIIFK